MSEVLESLDVLLVALEVAMWGRPAGEGAGTPGRWAALSAWGAAGAAPGRRSVEELAREAMTSLFLPPAVELPGGRGFAAFLPMVFLGVFADRAEALSVVGRWDPERDALPALRPHGRSFVPGYAPAECKYLRPVEWAAIAPVVARHWRPLAGGAAPTPMAYYVERLPESLPRVPLSPDAVFAMPKGDGFVLGRVTSTTVVPKK